jgi:16S rRNA C1402 (ribose-2'-O) methylase RsmI
VKGEVVIVVEGLPSAAGSLTAAVAMARELHHSGQPKGAAAREAASAHGVLRRDVYEALLEEA